MRTAPLLVLLLAIGAPAAAELDERERHERELERLRERIEAVRDELAADREQRDDVSAELERIERRIGEVAGRIDRLDSRIGETRRRLAEIEREQAAARAELAAHRETLGAQLRAAHRMGEQPALRLLLRQQAPDAVSRAMTYYGYFNEARLDAMERTGELVDELAGLRAEAERRRERLASDRRDLAAEEQRLAVARGERDEILERLEREIAAGGNRLERLEADRERLRRLLDELRSMVADIPASPLEAQPFASRDGQLQWPVEGRVRTSFGSARAGGRMRWRGIEIEAAPGTPVRAVYHGRVVFADWLSGFGKLMIIDHLDGYMSLYGYNERMLRTEGSWVEPGERIAVVGNSGARERAGLYFEIRRDGEPRDPIAWLAAR